MSGSEPQPGNFYEWRQALFHAWTILSLAGFLIALSPFLVDHSILLQWSASVQSEHEPGSCSLCGMTRAFLLISQGDWSGAQAAHSYSLGLWWLFCLNFVLLAFASVKKSEIFCWKIRK